ncbi:MAG TPA: phytochelatin synthase family protein [Azospirillum sp.]|nr:phytochelatin synthase family protein [Azospirillum sp.]
MISIRTLVFAAVGTASLAVFAQVPTHLQEAKPKFGPDAIPITLANDYVRTHHAPDYWALTPYYVHQYTGSACSVASVAMMLNALRGLPNSASERLVTQRSLLEEVGDDAWKEAVAENGDGISFTDLEVYVRRALKAYGIKAEVEVFRPRDESPATLTQLRRILADNERSAEDIILLAFDQGTLTGDATVGHIAPLGAYDAASRRVLVMDVDRAWYVPYWSSDEKLLQAMLKPDRADPEGSGLIRVRVRHHSG